MGQGSCMFSVEVNVLVTVHGTSKLENRNWKFGLHAFVQFFPISNFKFQAVSGYVSNNYNYPQIHDICIGWACYKQIIQFFKKMIRIVVFKKRVRIHPHISGSF